MTQWIVYQSPCDYPGKVVVRGVDIFADEPQLVHHTECAVFESLEDARAAIPPHLYRLERHPSDPAPIVEVWI